MTALREQMARELSTLTTCHGEEWPGELQYRQADALLAGSLAPLLAKLRSVEELANEYADREHDHYIGDGHHGCAACWVDDIRHALDAS
jgi:hypothetical protein